MNFAPAVLHRSMSLLQALMTFVLLASLFLKSLHRVPPCQVTLQTLLKHQTPPWCRRPPCHPLSSPSVLSHGIQGFPLRGVIILGFAHPSRPPLHSIVVVPEVLGTAFGPIIQGGAGGSPHPPAVGSSAWQTKSGRRSRSPTSPPRPRAPAPPRRRSPVDTLPTKKPPKTRILAVLHGGCNNCGDDDHISAKYWKKTKCIRSGGDGHIAQGCTRPRSPSPLERQVRLPPTLRRTKRSPPPAQCFDTPPLPPPQMQSSLVRSETSLPPPPPLPPPSRCGQGLIMQREC